VEFAMDVTGWMIVTFALGLVSMAAFYAFVLACEKV
jgi:hypothetical protein